MGANFGLLPGAKNMTGSRAFSAAGQNQSADNLLLAQALAARQDVLVDRLLVDDHRPDEQSDPELHVFSAPP